MCLLLVGFRAGFDVPLVVGANRDERYDRPADPVRRRGAAPRILAGLDVEAGGTWLAANEAGVVAALTNQPVELGRDPSKRTRGELPFLLAAARSAREGVDALIETVDPQAYNPCSVLVGDRSCLFSLELGTATTVQARELPPGRYGLENRPFGVETPKTRFVQARFDGIDATATGELLRDALRTILADHRPAPRRAGETEPRRPEQLAACVHGERSGTRSSLIVVVPPGAGLAEVWSADGPPCTTPYRNVSGEWDRPAGGG